MTKPSPKGPNGAGRGANGRFLPGWSGGPGNPHAKRVGKLRTALLKAVTEADIRAIARKLVELAKGGNVPAAREVIDRCIGKPTETDLIERIERLEATSKERER